MKEQVQIPTSDNYYVTLPEEDIKTALIQRAAASPERVVDIVEIVEEEEEEEELMDVDSPPPPPEEDKEKIRSPPTNPDDVDTDPYGSEDETDEIKVLKVVRKTPPPPPTSNNFSMVAIPSTSAALMAEIKEERRAVEEGMMMMIMQCAFCADILRPPRTGIVLAKCSHVFCRYVVK
jgi:hypothetical protein